MRFLFFSIIFSVLFYNVSIADNIKDTIPPTFNDIKQDTEELSDFYDDLDSLLNLWYVKTSIKQSDYAWVVDTFNEETDTICPLFPDSVYKQRLADIQSVIPLDYNDIVKRFIELYTVKRRRQVSVMLGLSDYYFPIFENELDKAGLPLELKYLPVIESALNPIARSRAGAIGIWQFIYPTAKLYGLKVNSYIDERRDPYLATKAAVHMLKDLYKMYNDWILVIAAYNCGPGNVNKAIRRAHGKTNYWDIYYYLPRETRGYVPAFIAAAYVFNYAKEHKIPKTKIVSMQATDTIMIDTYVHFGQISGVLGIPIQQLRELNLQYRRDIIPGSKKHPYPLRLPVLYVGQYVELEDSIPHYKDSLYFASNYESKRPRSIRYNRYKYSGNSYKPKNKNLKKLYYTVKPGDNLGFISSWYNVPIRDIKRWNGLYSHFIKAGQKLVIYVPKKKYSFYKKINSMTFAQKQKRIGAPVSNVKSTQKTGTTYAKGKYVYYTVKPGDNFWSIAKKFPGVSNYDIMKLNGIKNERSLKPGQILKIKRID